MVRVSVSLQRGAGGGGDGDGEKHTVAACVALVQHRNARLAHPQRKAGHGPAGLPDIARLQGMQSSRRRKDPDEAGRARGESECGQKEAAEPAGQLEGRLEHVWSAVHACMHACTRPSEDKLCEGGRRTL